MKILFIVMGILSLFTSCTNRKVKLTEEVDSVQNGFEVKENKSRLDNDTLPSNMFSSNKGNDTCLVLILVDCVLKKSCYRLSINVKKQTILS